MNTYLGCIKSGFTAWLRQYMWHWQGWVLHKLCIQGSRLKVQNMLKIWLGLSTGSEV